jgi:hypothetical protein
MWAARSSAAVETLAGDIEASERELRAALQLGLGFRERGPVAEIAAGLSRVLSIPDRSMEAAGFATMSVDYAPAEGTAAQALWRAAKARVMASRDDQVEAERLAREAVGLAPAEMLNLRADLLTDLAGVLLGRVSKEPVVDGGDGDGGLLADLELVVPGGDGAVALEPVDAALHRMALLVDLLVEGWWPAALGALGPPVGGPGRP